MATLAGEQEAVPGDPPAVAPAAAETDPLAHASVAPDAGWLENGAEVLSGLALLVMIGLVGAEAIVRNVFGGSLQLTDEVCGYLLVAVTFLSMAVSEAHRSFHRVELVLGRMGLRARVRLELAFDACALAASLVLLWQLGRMVLNSWRTGDVAPTPLQTPLWIPQSVMVLGTALLCVALLRTMRARRRLLRHGGVQ